MRGRYILTLIVLALMMSVVAMPAMAKTEISVALHTSPPGPEHDAVAYFKKLVEERSNGDLTVNIYAGGVLGGERDNVEQLKVGQVSMSLFGDLLTSQLAPDLDPTVVPFIFPSIEATYGYYNSEMGEKLNQALIERGGVRVVGLERRGARHLTAERPIRTPADVKGLKLRVPEIDTWVKVWSQVGALPTPVAWPEVFSALQTGVVDGQENPFFNIYQARLFEVQKYVMLTAHLYGVFHWTVSEKFLNSLSSEQQKIVLDSAKEAAEYGDNLAAEQIEGYRQKLVDEGMQIIEVDKKAFSQAAKPAIQRLSQDWAPGVWDYVSQYFE